jgi:hypothetical protein
MDIGRRTIQHKLQPAFPLFRTSLCFGRRARLCAWWCSRWSNYRWIYRGVPYGTSHLQHVVRDISDGTSARAAAHFVPSFGPNGLLFVLGGQVGYSATYVSTSSVNFFDPVSQQWKIQAVSGNPPPPSETSCVVGAPGDNGTYEVGNHFPAISVAYGRITDLPLRR